MILLSKVGLAFVAEVLMNIAYPEVSPLWIVKFRMTVVLVIPVELKNKVVLPGVSRIVLYLLAPLAESLSRMMFFVMFAT